ncbi:MAG TPA: DUF5908 family protein [Pyrinomonadaceae bacterium]|jgi:hypothetical protein
MALEINEIAIQMQVADSDVEPSQSEATAEGGSDEKIDYEKIVDECVRRVLQAIKQMKER